MKEKFNKIVALEPLLITKEGKKTLNNFAKEIVFYETIATDEKDIIKRIGDADCILLRFSTKITAGILNNCPKIQYIGMGCSYYGDQFSNLDMHTARKNGIQVTYLKDYGDEGVTEGIIAQLITLLHGFGKMKRSQRSCELGGMKIGIIGLGTTGILTAHALKHFGCDVYYYSRTRKIEQENLGIKYLPLEKLLETVEVISTHLPRDTKILHEKEFKKFGNGKIFINTSIGSTYDINAMKKWLDNSNNFHICDSPTKTLENEIIRKHPQTIYIDQSFGETQQCVQRSTRQTLRNIRIFLDSQHIRQE